MKRAPMLAAAASTALIALAAATFADGQATATAPAEAAPPASAPAPVPGSVPAPPHLVAAGDMDATLKNSPDFTILVKALDATNLSGVLRTTPDLTLFAPTDEAFRALPPGQLAELLMPKNAAVLQKVLTYHLVHLDLDSSKIKGAKGPVESVEKGKLQIDGSSQPLMVNNADIIQADVHATNGVIHVVDKVLVPADVTLPSANAAAPTSAPG
ncbi:MAG TPA: fasciclin domain-containing protein [Caulobacteraceae bacterium]